MARDIYVLITHECSGTVRERFNSYSGVRAFSCDLKAAEDGRTDLHIRGDALEAMRSRRWDFIGMHPECRFLTGSGLHWNNRGRGWDQTNAALKHVDDCRKAAGDVPYYLENSIGILSTHWRKPDQIIQPYDFGADASKATCLWLNKLPQLRATKFVEPRYVCCGTSFPYANGKYGCANCNGEKTARPRWANQTDSGQNKLGPSETRSADRARTYPGIAAAMADQWVPFLLKLIK